MATAQQCFDAITARMKQAAGVTASATIASDGTNINAIMDRDRRRKRKPVKPSPSVRFDAVAIDDPAEAELLARAIEQSALDVETIAKRSRVDQHAIESFLAGDADALTDDDAVAILAVIETDEEMATTARNIRAGRMPAVTNNATTRKPPVSANDLRLKIQESKFTVRETATRAKIGAGKLFAFVNSGGKLTKFESERLAMALGL